MVSRVQPATILRHIIRFCNSFLSVAPRRIVGSSCLRRYRWIVNRSFSKVLRHAGSSYECALLRIARICPRSSFARLQAFIVPIGPLSTKARWIESYRCRHPKIGLRTPDNSRSRVRRRWRTYLRLPKDDYQHPFGLQSASLGPACLLLLWHMPRCCLPSHGKGAAHSLEEVTGLVAMLVDCFSEKNWSRITRIIASCSSSTPVRKGACSWASLPTQPVRRLFGGLWWDRWCRRLGSSLLELAVVLGVWLSWFDLACYGEVDAKCDRIYRWKEGEDACWSGTM